MFSDRWTLPLSMPTSNSATAFLSTSRAGFAKFDLGAEHASKRITICEVLGQTSREEQRTYDYGKKFGACETRAEELDIWRAGLTCFRATFDESERRAVERHD
jgi:hypothetical protein